MNEFIRKLFIKDYNDVLNPKIRKKHGVLASCVGAISNAILFAFKLLVGLLSFSITIVTDAINNLTDMCSSIVNLVGFKLASKPADKKHPFGHERIEYIAGMIISFVIIGIAIFLGYESIQKIITNEGVTISIFSFIVLPVAILVKLWQGLFYRHIAKAINSSSLKASSVDSINDVISTSVVLIITIIEFSLDKAGIKIPFSLDGVAGVILTLFIIITGIKLIIETSNPLIGLTPDHELVKKVLNKISSYEGVLGVHDLMCHSYGPTKIFMTIHVEVDARENVLKSHDLIDNIENDITTNYGVILTIHLDPIDNYSSDVNEIKKMISKIIESYSNVLSFHDFRIVKGETHTNILFDLVIPYESDLNVENLNSYLNSEVYKVNPKYILKYKIDRDYTGK